MSENKKNYDKSGQFVVSYDLLYLLKWLVENEQDALKKLVDKAFKNHSYRNFATMFSVEEKESEDELRSGVLDFFGLFEMFISEALQNIETLGSFKKNSFSAVDQIDLNLCDIDSVEESFIKASSKFSFDSEDEFKKAFCKELLRQWKPPKKQLS